MDTAHAINWKGVGQSDVGRVRTTNQDAFAIEDHLGLWMVADGMGGRAGGEVASRLAIESVKTFLRPEQGIFGRTDPNSALHEAIADGDRTIRHEVSRRPELDGMGTTLVVLWLIKGSRNEFALAHIGDSRAYLLRENTLTQLTRDHSLMEDYVSRGIVTPSDALSHPQRNVLTRALGIAGQSEPDFATVVPQNGDVILLCTDGLTKMLKDEEIRDHLLRPGLSPVDMCRALIEAANNHGGQDNVTVVLIRQESAQ